MDSLDSLQHHKAAHRRGRKPEESQLLQGLNSWTSVQGGGQAPEDCCCYGGMSPPDCPHLYELHVYALDTLLPLKKGYWVNELYHAMRGHILDSFTLEGVYDSEP